MRGGEAWEGSAVALGSRSPIGKYFGLGGGERVDEGEGGRGGVEWPPSRVIWRLWSPR